MKLKAHALMQGNPEFELKALCNPIGFEVAADGSLKLQTGPIAAEIGEIPITLRIPFLRRAGGVQIVGSIGAFSVRLLPIDAELRSISLKIGGTLGKDRLACNLEGRITCKTEVDLDASIPAKVTRVAFNVAEDEPGESES